MFAYKGSTRLEFISLADDELQNGDYYIILSDDCDKLRMVCYCAAHSSISCIISTFTGKLSDIDKTLQDINKELQDVDNKEMKFYPELIQSNFVATRLPDANDALPNTMYQFASSNIPENMPSGITLGDSEILFTTSTKYVFGNTDWKYQYLFDSKFNLLYSRMFNVSWSAWKANAKPHYIEYYPQLVTANNLQSILPDANDAADFVSYVLETSNIPLNFPDGYDYFSLGGEPIVLTTIVITYNDNNLKIQTINSATNGRNYYWRRYNGVSWTNWTAIYKKDYVQIYPNIVVAKNISSILPDANDALSNTIYRLQSSVNPTNFPNYFLAGQFVYLETRDSYYVQGLHNQKQQTIYDQQMRPLWTRSCQGTTWDDWVSVWHHIKVGQGSEYGYYKGWAFSKLYDAIAFAANNPNTEIEVFDGTYDLISEMGDDWATNYYGTPLGANMKIKFHENAYVTCNYTGDDQRKLTEFSAFAVIGGDFEIDGLKLSCSRIRYPIHDDNASNQLTHTHIYKNCEIIFDNTDNESWEAKQCIGGGFGNSTKVIIENCYFESVGADTTHPEVSYHNVGYGTSAKSSVIINNCYFKNSSCWFGYYGQTQLMSQVRVSNCSMKCLPKAINETGDAPNVNIELKQWNNEIRL